MSISKRVLIVDDDRDFVRAVSTLLQSAGYLVCSADHGQEGLRAALAWQPDVILLDVMMRERTEGFFVLQEIRRTPALRNTPVLVISSIYTECPGFRITTDAGWLPAEQFLQKPADSGELLATLERLLARPAFEGAQAAGPKEDRP